MRSFSVTKAKVKRTLQIGGVAEIRLAVLTPLFTASAKRM